MRFLQASDFHLHPEYPERLHALVEVLDRAAEERVDTVLVPGDLFDRPAAGDALRAELGAFPASPQMVPADKTAVNPDGREETVVTPLARNPGTVRRAA